MLDLKKIGKFCKKKHIDFIVDEAHGSLFPFNSNLPTSALQIDCDFVLHSAHKYLGGLVQTAFLHLPRTSSYSPIQVSRLKKVFESTTKSNLLLASLEEITNKNFLVFLRSKIDLLLNECKKIRESSKSLSNIQIVSFQSNDPLKFYIFSPKISTQKLAILFLEKGFDFEYYDDNGILFIIPINIPVISLRKFYRVLTLIDSEITLMAASKAKQKFEYNNPIIKMTPREAFSAAKVMYIPLKDAIGRISADLIAKCPPGIPLLLPGELITKWHMDAIGKEQLVTIVDSKNIN